MLSLLPKLFPVAIPKGLTQKLSGSPTLFCIYGNICGVLEY